jgi:hypothetical protein
MSSKAATPELKKYVELNKETATLKNKTRDRAPGCFRRIAAIRKLMRLGQYTA